MGSGSTPDGGSNPPEQIYSLLSQNAAVNFTGEGHQCFHHGFVGQLQCFIDGFPLIISVAMLEVAMAAPQLKVFNLTSVMTLPSIFKNIFRCRHRRVSYFTNAVCVFNFSTLRGLAK